MRDVVSEVPKWLRELDIELTHREIIMIEENRNQIEEISDKVNAESREVENYLQVVESLDNSVERVNKYSRGIEAYNISSYDSELKRILEKRAETCIPTIHRHADD